MDDKTNSLAILISMIKHRTDQEEIISKQIVLDYHNKQMIPYDKELIIEKIEAINLVLYDDFHGSPNSQRHSLNMIANELTVF